MLLVMLPLVLNMIRLLMGFERDEIMELISLEEHDHKARIRYHEPKRTGIACPECGEELVLSGSTVLLTCPPQYPVKCSVCDWTGIKL